MPLDRSTHDSRHDYSSTHKTLLSCCRRQGEAHPYTITPTRDLTCFRQNGVDVVPDYPAACSASAPARKADTRPFPRNRLLQNALELCHRDRNRPLGKSRRAPPGTSVPTAPFHDGGESAAFANSRNDTTTFEGSSSPLSAGTSEDDSALVSKKHVIPVIPGKPFEGCSTSLNMDSTRQQPRPKSNDPLGPALSLSVTRENKPGESAILKDDLPEMEAVTPGLLSTQAENAAIPVASDIPSPPCRPRSAESQASLPNNGLELELELPRPKRAKARAGKRVMGQRSSEAGKIVQDRGMRAASSLGQIAGCLSLSSPELDAIGENVLLTASQVAGVALYQEMERNGWPAEVDGHGGPRVLATRLPDINTSTLLLQEPSDTGVESQLPMDKIRYPKLIEAAVVLEELATEVRKAFQKAGHQNLYMPTEQLATVALSRVCDHLLVPSEADAKGDDGRQMLLAQIKDLDKEFGKPNGDVRQ